MGKPTRKRTDNRVSIWRKASAVFMTGPTAIFVLTLALFIGRNFLLSPQVLGTLNIAFYILVVVGMAFSAGFNRGRAVLILLLLMLIHLAQDQLSVGPSASVIYYFSSILLPVTILLFSLHKEGGLLTSQGKLRMWFVLVELLLVAVVVASQDKDIFEYIRQDLSTPNGFLPTPVPVKAILAIGAAVLVTFGRQLTKFSIADNAFFYSVLALAAAFHFQGVASVAPLFYCGTAVILVVAAIQDAYFIAYLDELTGLPSRRSLQDELAKLGDKYAVAMVDIDHFKRINDTYGHDVGDDMLRFIASILQGEVGGDGKAFRYGGEEFTVLFPGKTKAEVMPYLEELRDKIAKRPFFLRGKKASTKWVWVTVSIGAADKDGKNRAAEEIIKAADVALYRAKEGGRNRVCE